jgi:hypothetical protein
MQAVLKSHVIADSDDIVESGGYQYFPSAATRLEWLEKAPKTEHDLDARMVSSSTTWLSRASVTDAPRGPTSRRNRRWRLCASDLGSGKACRSAERCRGTPDKSGPLLDLLLFRGAGN